VEARVRMNLRSMIHPKLLQSVMLRNGVKDNIPGNHSNLIVCKLLLKRDGKMLNKLKRRNSTKEKVQLLSIQLAPPNQLRKLLKNKKLRK
jgi:hypothetical protein